jgi:hypothetical protein
LGIALFAQNFGGNGWFLRGRFHGPGFGSRGRLPTLGRGFAGSGNHLGGMDEPGGDGVDDDPHDQAMRDAGDKARNVLSAGEGRHGCTIGLIGANPAGELTSALSSGLFIGTVPGFAAAADGRGFQVFGDGETFGRRDDSGHEFLQLQRNIWDVSFIVREEGEIICKASVRTAGTPAGPTMGAMMSKAMITATPTIVDLARAEKAPTEGKT